jgi:hypothetical protein
MLEISPKIELQMLILKGQTIQNRLYVLKDSTRRLESKAKQKPHSHAKNFRSYLHLCYKFWDARCLKTLEAYYTAKSFIIDSLVTT